jgi:penicillin-binding protein 1A
MPAEWRLAAVLAVTDAEVRLGWMEGADQRRTGALALADHAWARPLRDGKPGPAPRRMQDIVQPGDVVMIDPQGIRPPPATPAVTRPGQPPPAPALTRVALRQIPLVQGALVSLEPTTGRVLAMVGGWSFEQSQFNRVTQAQRQPGSSFKPIVYLTALSRGVSPSQRFLDAPIVVDTPAGRWRPGNYEGTFNGPVPMRLALEKSLNLVTLRIAQQMGMQAVAETAIAFHMVDSMPRVLPAALGAVETTVLREAGAYASLAAGGREVIPTLIDSVQDRNGHVVSRAGAVSCPGCDDGTRPPVLEDGRKQIADPAAVFQLVTMMQGAVQRGTGTRAGQGLGRPIAGKTGTTQDFADTWFSGFTPDLVTTVWVGFDVPTPLGSNETGGSVAAPIFREFMAVALKDRPVLTFPQPDGVSMAAWDSGNGQVTDAFRPGQTPGASGAFATGSGEDAPPGGSPRTAAGGVDSTLPGLY